MEQTDTVNKEANSSEEELLRLQQRVLELEAELGQRSWQVGDFYRIPTVKGTPDVLGQVVTIANTGRPFQVIEAAKPDLMDSVPTIRQLSDGLAPNVVGCDKPEWWPL